MVARRRLIAAAGAGFALAHGAARAQAGAPTLGELTSLGDERYGIGRIVVDRRARSFTVPGRVHALDKPLEYLATSRGGRKSYESLLELDASGTEMNLACILIGLERDPKLDPSQPPNIANARGQRVDIWVAWTQEGQRRKVTAAEALFNALAREKVESVEWVYTGSYSSIDGSRFAADHTGTLISFIRDPNGIIEVASSAGLGAYGSVRGGSMLPPEGAPVELVVAVAQAPSK